MQKCQSSIFKSDPPSGSPFLEALVPQGDLRSNKLFLEFFFLGGVYFMIKCLISKIINTPPPPSGSPFGEALAPQGDLASKKGIKH